MTDFLIGLAVGGAGVAAVAGILAYRFLRSMFRSF
jgi:hypothetical protein